MTNPFTDQNTDPHALPDVTLDRIIAGMKSFEIELERVAGRDDAATANLNGLPCMFAVLDTVAIVRCDVPTDVEYAKADAGLFLAANQINSVSMGARAVIADFDGTLLVRTEADIPCAAGMNDEQLANALKRSVDGVIDAQNAMVAAAEEMAKLGSESAAEAGADSAESTANTEGAQ